VPSLGHATPFVAVLAGFVSETSTFFFHLKGCIFAECPALIESYACGRWILARHVWGEKGPGTLDRFAITGWDCLGQVRSSWWCIRQEAISIAPRGPADYFSAWLVVYPTAFLSEPCQVCFQARSVRIGRSPEF